MTAGGLRSVRHQRETGRTAARHPTAEWHMGGTVLRLSDTVRCTQREEFEGFSRVFQFQFQFQFEIEFEIEFDDDFDTIEDKQPYFWECEHHQGRNRSGE